MCVRRIKKTSKRNRRRRRGDLGVVSNSGVREDQRTVDTCRERSVNAHPSETYKDEVRLFQCTTSSRPFKSRGCFSAYGESQQLVSGAEREDEK